jgi:hypothetical protein
MIPTNTTTAHIKIKNTLIILKNSITITKINPQQIIRNKLNQTIIQILKRTNKIIHYVILSNIKIKLYKLA